MSTTVTRRGHHAIHVSYGEESYSVGSLGSYFMSINGAFRLVLQLVNYRAANPSEELPLSFSEEPPPLDPVPTADVESPEAGGLFTPLARIKTPRWTHSFPGQSPWLKVERIQLNSPLDITLAIEAAGTTGVTVYAMHLLSAVLRHPERIGGWLPRLAAGCIRDAAKRGRLCWNSVRPEWWTREGISLGHRN